MLLLLCQLGKLGSVGTSSRNNALPEHLRLTEKCRFCGAETVGSDVCWKCLDNPERQEFLEKAKNYKAPKTFPSYAAFCDDEETKTGFKPARVAQWLADNEHFKADKQSGILYYGDQETSV